ncbi:MAG: hypothetical protein U0587_04000 [Candidatus Binatia bacterium]
MSETTLRRHAPQALAAAAVLGVYLLAGSVMPKDVFWHPDEGAKFLAMQSIRWAGQLTYAVPYRGRTLDPSWAFYPGRCDRRGLYPFPEPGGGIRLHWPIWFPLLSRVFYALFGLSGIYVIPLLSGWLTAVVAGQWLTPGSTSRARATTIVLVGCASPIMFYSLCFSEHTLATLLGTLALASLVASAPGRRSVAWAAVPLLVLCVALRVEMLALVAAVLVAWGGAAFVTPGRSVVAKTLRQIAGGRLRGRVPSAVAICLLLLGIVALESLLTPRHWELLRTLPNVAQGALTRWRFLPRGVVYIFFGPPEFQTRLPSWMWSALLFMAMSAAGAAPFVRSRRVEALLLLPALLVLLEASLLMALASDAYLNRQGILAVAPYVVIAPYALADAWRRRQRGLFRLAVCTVCYAAIGFAMLFLTRFANEGIYLIGLDGAARYMLTLYPAGTALALCAVRSYRQSDRSALMRSTFVILTAGLVGVSILYQARGLQMLYGSRNTLVTWQQALQHDVRVVTDVWWFAAACPTFFVTHEFYCLPDRAALPNWVADAGREAAAFTFVSRQPLASERFTSAAGELVLTGRDVVAGLYLYRFRLADRGAP